MATRTFIDDPQVGRAPLANRGSFGLHHAQSQVTELHRSDSAAWTQAARESVARWKPVSSTKNKLLTPLVILGTRLWMQCFNTLVIEDRSRLASARKDGRGLLTFSNHISLFDDPLLTSCMSNTKWSNARWIAADASNFFGTQVRSAVFNAGKCVPIVRGAGVDQPGMKFLAARLKVGDWVHIFPEGSRSRDPHGRLQTPLKTGLAELIRESAPMVLPFYHDGMSNVLPIGSRLPHMGKTVTLRFGEPNDSTLQLAELSSAQITEWATNQLLALEAEALTARPGEGSLRQRWHPLPLLGATTRSDGLND